MVDARLELHRSHHAHSAEWFARQITEASPWDAARRYMIPDRDRICGAIVTRRLPAVGLRDKPTAPSAPCQNGFCRTDCRIDPARVVGSCGDWGRAAFTSGPEILRRLLQWCQNASIFEQGRAGFSPGSADRCHRFKQYRWRTSSPIRSRLGFRRGRN
jgi:hypothetical protein